MANPFVILFIIALFVIGISRFDEFVKFLQKNTEAYKTTDETWSVIEYKRY